MTNKFKEKQIDIVGELVKVLNSSVFEIIFTSFSTGSSTSGTVYNVNIFEIENLTLFENKHQQYDLSVAFSKNSNQLFDFKPFLNNTYLPKRISAELEKFYSRNTHKVSSDEIIGQKIVVIYSNYYEANIWDKTIVNNFAIWETDAFAFLSLDNLIECSTLLKKSIVEWLKQNNINDININTHMTH